MEPFKVSKLTKTFNVIRTKRQSVQIGVQYTGENKERIIRFIRTHGSHTKAHSVEVKDNGTLVIGTKHAYLHSNGEVGWHTRVHHIPLNWCVITCPLYGVTIYSPEDVLEFYDFHKW